jgi:hypothetical protein
MKWSILQKHIKFTQKTQKHFEASIPGAVFTTPHFLRNL